MDNILHTYKAKGNIGRSLLYTLPMLLITFILMSGGDLSSKGSADLLAFTITHIFLNVCFFQMHYKGKTDRYRSVVFIVFALFLSFTFITNMFEYRGAMTFSQADLVECNVPFCHLVIPMMIVPAALTESIIFPGSILDGFANISTMLVLWGVATIVMGRGFCSWGCFYGGWDEGFSRIRRKPFLTNINTIWRWMPFAVLFTVIATASLTLVPTYCDWICPFKAVTEFEAVTSAESVVKAIIFFLLFALLVIVLPLLSKKRAQCTSLCPLGALNSLSNKISAFTVKIDKSKCNMCMRCVNQCKLFAITADDLKRGRASVLCCKCGQCIDSCKQGAIQYSITGFEAGKLIGFSRNLFIFISFLFMAIFSSGSIQNGLEKIINLFIN